MNSTTPLAATSTGRSEQVDTDTTIEETFGQALSIAALADYFFISEQMKVGDECTTVASEPVAYAFLELFEALGIGCDGLIDDDNQMFVDLVFRSAEEKEKADDYFTSFNFFLRQQFGIPMPDIYEGQAEPVKKVHQQYQTTIHHFFTPDSGRPLRIPIGRDSARIEAMAQAVVGKFHGINDGERAGRTIHAEFTEAGLRGFNFFNNW
jgi:hypothetical protein